MPKNRLPKKHYRNVIRGYSERGNHAKPPCVRHIPQVQLPSHNSYRIGNASREEMRLQIEGGFGLTNKLNSEFSLR